MSYIIVIWYILAMSKEQDIKEIFGYISIAEAAKRLGVAPSRVYDYIDSGRLDILVVGDATVVAENSLEHFKLLSATGRPRKKATRWHKSPQNAKFVISVIRVPLREQQKERLIELLDQMRQANKHLFLGTMERYIAEDDDDSGMIEIQLVWKQNEMPDEATYKQQLAAFQETFAEVLDWSTARYSTKTVLLHT